MIAIQKDAIRISRLNNSTVRNTVLLQMLNVLGYVVTILVNYLANSLPINNRTTGELAATYPNLFTPAGFTFSIWGLIYLALAAFVVYQTGVLGKRRNQDLSVVTDIGLFFFISSLANAGWIFAWHYMMVPLSMAVMLVLLGSLVVIYSRLRRRTEISQSERWFVHVPFSLYLGWISVATLANLSALFVDIGFDGFALFGQIWTTIFLIVATLLGVAFLIRGRDPAYGLVIAWALIGILTRHATELGARYTAIMAVAALCLTAILVAAVWVGFTTYWHH